MKQVLPNDLISGRKYRIHWNFNGQNHQEDMLGTFVRRHLPNGPIFTDINSRNPLYGNPAYPGQLPRINQPYEVAFDPMHFTFYESADTLLRDQHLKDTFNDIVPGLSKMYTGRGKKSRRTRR